MKRVAYLACLVLLMECGALRADTADSFDSGWLFLNADATNAEQIQFSDSAWRQLNLPHDWSIEGPFSQTNKTGGAGAFLPGGVGWYRKHFSLPTTLQNQVISVAFDGVMQNSDVWINGFHLGHRPYGYVGFEYDLTGHLNFGGDNVLAVRVDESQEPASRWYSGAGIYRHVRLVVSNPFHFLQNGISVSTPKVSRDQAIVRVEAVMTNESDSLGRIAFAATIDGRHWIESPTWVESPQGGSFAPVPNASAPRKKQSTISNADGISIGGRQSLAATFDILVRHPRLWDLDRPNLYNASVRLVYKSVSSAGDHYYRVGAHTLDEQTVTFGIRDARFEANTGFWLNGKNFKIKGVAVHVDGSAFGAAVPSSVWEERLRNLKALGVNAIRTAHNPPAPEFLDLCDRMGFLVMDEFFDCWKVGKNPYDYHLYFDQWSKQDERDTILRDRNHPSIILYSIGNEIHDTPHPETATNILKGLVEVAHETDPTRPVTQALFRPNVSHDYDNGLADLLDVVGQNYRENEILAAHDQKQTRKIIGTENHHDRAAWVALRDHAPYSGQFLWTGVDYLGESRRWPVIAAGSGLLDRTGAPKPMGFERESWWSDAPMVAIVRRVAPSRPLPTDPGLEPAQQDVLRRPQILFRDWTPTNSEPHDENVEIYSNCQEVELFLNGKSLGKKLLNADASPRNWTVSFSTGKIKAVARDATGRVVASDTLETAGRPAKIVLSATRTKISDRWDDVCEVRAEITDDKGNRVPSADNLVSFKVSRAGEVAAVDSADNASHEPFQSNERHAFQGDCVAFVRAAGSSGRIVVTAESPALESGKASIRIGE